MSGETLSLGSSGVVVIDGNSTATLAQPTLVTEGIIRVGSSTLNFAEVGSAVVVGTSTLIQGSVVTINGETVSLLAGGSSLVVVSGTQTSTMPLIAAATETEAPGATSGQPACTAFSNNSNGLAYELFATRTFALLVLQASVWILSIS